MRKSLALMMVLAGCAAQPDDDIINVDVITIDGVQMTARQEKNWPAMIAPINPATGKMEFVQSGTADTVIIGGSPDNRDRAIAALAQFCGKPIDPAGYDTQPVFKDPKTGDWWFDQWTCR